MAWGKLLADVALKHLSIGVGRQTVDVHCPQSLVAILGRIYGTVDQSTAEATHSISLEPINIDGAQTFEIFDSLGTLSADVHEAEALPYIVEALTRIATQCENRCLAFNADVLVREESPILFADTSSPGRVLATAWLAGRSFKYVGSDWALLDLSEKRLQTRQGAVILDEGASQTINRLPGLSGEEIIESGRHKIALLDRYDNGEMVAPALIVLPYFEEGAQFSASVLGPDEASVSLSRCLLNSSQLESGGFDQTTSLAQQTPVISVKFGAPEQLDRLIQFIDAVLASGLPAQSLKGLADALLVVGATPSSAVSAPPAPTPKRGKKRLTIGMATYDDFDGVYFTLQSLRLHHAEVMNHAELIVVDNNPTGACAQSLKKFETSVPNFRYVPHGENTGPSGAKDRIFKEAAGDFVLVMDCHVLLAPGTLSRLAGYLNEFHESGDLLQGPMIRNNLTSVYTHWDPVWRKGMFGIWSEDSRGVDVDLPPFDIPMQGSGLFACRRDAWPGFNPLFRGFGGEEGYIHEKFRQNGGRTLCLPFLRWLHRFERPMGVPYPVIWEDRLRNYLIGFHELNLALDPVVEHFKEIIGSTATRQILESVNHELAVQKSQLTAAQP